MKRMALAAAVAAGILMMVGIVGLIGNSTFSGSTPEDVAERFVRTLVVGDYEGALSCLDESLNEDIDTIDMRHFALFIAMRSGEVHDVRGVRGTVRGSHADASARLTTEAGGDWSLHLKMVRARGSWSIAAIGTIENASTSSDTYTSRHATVIASLPASTIHIEC